jgi:dienelactone hydrolase
MLEQVGKEAGVQTDKILIFGFSAGAHFAHRFALWKPERVKAEKGAF